MSVMDLWLGVVAFFTLTLLDGAWAVYVLAVAQLRPGWAAAAAVVLFLLGATAVLVYTQAPWTLLPASAGAALGTYVVVSNGPRRDE